MLEQPPRLRVTKNDKEYILLLPGDCPLGEVFDVLYQMRSYIVERINSAQKTDEPKEIEVTSE